MALKVIDTFSTFSGSLVVDNLFEILCRVPPLIDGNVVLLDIYISSLFSSDAEAEPESGSSSHTAFGTSLTFRGARGFGSNSAHPFALCQTTLSQKSLKTGRLS